MDRADRQGLQHAFRASGAERIIVLHGNIAMTVG